MAASVTSFANFSFLNPIKTEVKTANSWRVNFAAKSQDKPNSRNVNRSGRQIWRRRKLTKQDDRLGYALERVPFLEEQVRKMKDTGKILIGDIDRLLLSEDNRFHLVNEIAAEARQMVDNNPDEYFEKKAIYHVISNRMNEMGYYRPEGYLETDQFRPGPDFVRDELIV